MSVQEGEDEEGGKDSPKGFSDSITKGIDERFKEDIKISEGGFSSVRYVEKGISMFESSLGWLGTTASASINHQRVDAFVDQV